MAPGGERTLVARALYRPELGTSPQRQVFQLHPNGYRFAAGHKVRLELLPMDFPYGRFSNGQLPISITDLELRIPTQDAPDGGQVRAPAAKFVPAGYALAADYRTGSAGTPGPAGGQPSGGVLGKKKQSSSGCLNARGGARGRRLGPAVLGRARAKQRRGFKGKLQRARGGIDRYCAAGGGSFRVGYPTARLNRTLPGRARKRVGGRAILILTTSKRFSVRGLKVGSSVSTLRKRLKGERRIRVGRNVWFTAAGKGSRLLFRTRGGKVREVGIGDRGLTTARSAQKRFLRAWQLGG